MQKSKQIKVAIIASLVAMAVMLEVVCDAIPFLDLDIFWAAGGGISLAMLPLILLAYLYGPIYGVVAGVVFGLINLLLGGYLIHPASLVFDYLLAFGSIGLAGLFKKAMYNSKIQFLFGFLVVIGCRIVFHTISGIVAYEVPFWGSLTYNVPYVLISGMLCWAVGIVIYRQLQIIFNISKYEKEE